MLVVLHAVPAFSESFELVTGEIMWGDIIAVEGEALYFRVHQDAGPLPALPPEPKAAPPGGEGRPEAPITRRIPFLDVYRVSWLEPAGLPHVLTGDWKKHENAVWRGLMDVFGPESAVNRALREAREKRDRRAREVVEKRRLPDSFRASVELRLVSGDRLPGDELQIDSATVQVEVSGGPDENYALGVPRDWLRELWKFRSERESEARSLLSEKHVTAGLDVAFIEKDGRLRAVEGRLLRREDDRVFFEFRGEEREVELSRLEGVIFGSPREWKPSFRQRVRFRSGTALSGRWAGLADDGILWETPWGQQYELSFDSVIEMEFLDGRVSSLSDRRPSEVEETPFFDRLLPYRVDESLFGQELRLQEGTCSRGIAVHSRSRLHYDLEEGIIGFRARLGFQQPGGRAGRVDARVLGDGKVLWMTKDARGDGPTIPVAVEFEGVRRLTLEVDYGEGQDIADRVVWGNARLVRD